MFDVSTGFYAELGFQHLTAIVVLPQRIPLPTQGNQQPNYDDMPLFVERIYAETVKVLASPDVKERLAKLGAEPDGISPPQFAARLADEVALWRRVIADAHIEKQ